jgi:hypothetical protein
MAKDKHVFIPEALGSRHGLPHNNYVRNGLEPVTLGGVSVEFGTPTKPHIHNVPTGDGAIARKMRRFGLIRSRFQLPNYKKSAKTFRATELATESASNAVCILGYRTAYADDPTIGTMSSAPIINLLNEGSVGKSIITHVLSYAGTQYFAEILDGLTDEAMREELKVKGDHLYGAYLMESDWSSYYAYLNSKTTSPYRYKRCMNYLAGLARNLDDLSDATVSNHMSRRDRKDGDKRKGDSKSGTKPEVSITDDAWETLVVAKPPLEIPHTGKLGRRFIPATYGKYPQYLHRELTDPYERIFKRKTRALGGIVVIDCSGSMSLDEDDIHRLLKASAGSTVICYSADLWSRGSSGDPNAWVVARNGRMVRKLPEFPGGNGVDAPVLKWAVDNYRRGSSTPVVWVSDGHVTGKRDQSTELLRKETKSVCKRYGITRVEEVNDAIKLLNKLQGKAR